VVEGDGRAEAMPDEMDRFGSDPADERFEIQAEGAEFAVSGIVGITVAPEIEGVDRPFLCDLGGEMVPPMGVRTAAMKKNQWCIRRLFGAEGERMTAMERYSIAGFESN
jgi:hypothetical protein